MEQALEPSKLGLAALVPAKQNRFALFDGSLLHGVLPSAEGNEVRGTLLINFWTTDPLVSREEDNVGLRDKEKACPKPMPKRKEPTQVQYEAVDADTMEDLARLELRLPLDEVPTASIDINVPGASWSNSGSIGLTNYARGGGAGPWVELDEGGEDVVRARLFPGAGPGKGKMKNEL